MGVGDVLSDGSDSFTCVMPDIPAIGGEVDPNEQSLVLFYETEKLSMLLTGDMGEAAERELLKSWRWPDDGRVHILKVAHHGSKGSSCEDFLAMVGREDFTALISVGPKNSYGHPHGDTLSRLGAAGATVKRTDLLGQITLKTGGKSVTIGGFLE